MEIVTIEVTKELQGHWTPAQMHYAPAWIPFVHLEPKSHPVSFQLFITVKIVISLVLLKLFYQFVTHFRTFQKSGHSDGSKQEAKKPLKGHKMLRKFYKKNFCSVCYSGFFSWWPVSLLIEIDAYGWMVTSAHAIRMRSTTAFFALLFWLTAAWARYPHS